MTIALPRRARLTANAIADRHARSAAARVGGSPPLIEIDLALIGLIEMRLVEEIQIGCQACYQLTAAWAGCAEQLDWLAA
jgi:hypothetical protein